MLQSVQGRHLEIQNLKQKFSRFGLSNLCNCRREELQTTLKHNNGSLGLRAPTCVTVVISQNTNVTIPVTVVTCEGSGAPICVTVVTWKFKTLKN